MHSVKKESETIDYVLLFCKDIFLLYNTFSQHIYRTTAIREDLNINNVMLGKLQLS